MIRYGTVAQKMRPMSQNDLLISRLKLLIIMAKAILKGYPMGDFRRDAIVQNARLVFYETLGRSTTEPSVAAPSPQTTAIDVNHLDHLFLQRAQLLAVMMNAFSQEKCEGRFRQKAMAENIEQICKYLSDHFHLGNIQFLKVA
jgi:hypothetical protein